MAFTGLVPARGCFYLHEMPAGSAFSRGDIVCLAASNSSISRIDFAASTPGDIYGVAATDSVNSVNGLCTVWRPNPDTEWISVATTANTLAIGAEVDFDEDAAGRPVVVASTNTARFVITEGPNDVAGQSVQSRVIGKFLYHAGNIELS